ncbi:MAG TPA: asparagine synthase-related protein [Parvularculaceae bacterium]|nr:asparagine synthase-related protein [Parvularculaceae bacterium]
MALFWRDETSSEAALQVAERAQRALDLRTSARFPRGVVLVSADTPVTLLEEGDGLVIGDIYSRVKHSRCSDKLDEKESNRIRESGGASLIDEFWGEYVAILNRDNDPFVLRDPSGGLLCYALRCDGFDAIVSDVEFGVSLGLVDGEIDWNALAQWLVQAGLRTERTCLKGVDEILSGASWSCSGGTWRRQTAWTPWTFAAPGRQFADRDEAVDILRDAIIQATKACARSARSTLLEMSGGLDSSIVAACLRIADVPVTCVSLWTSEAGGDERQYAQAVADHIAAPVHFVRLSAEDVGVTDLSPIRKPRPLDHPLKRVSDLILEREGLARGADSYFSGSGGDYVLGYLTSSAPAADALIARGPGRTFLNAVADVAELNSCSVWKICALAARRVRRRSARKDSVPRAFLSGDIAALEAQSHPWLAAPRYAWPGKLETVDYLARCQGMREERDRRRVAPLKMPLLTQPVVETCLRIPSWMAVTGGRNRAVARDAFADELPDKILKRRTKGNFTSFNAAIFERNRALLRDILLEGRLAAEGLLDRRALEDFFGSTRPLTGNAYASAIELASIELWTRTWR